MYSINKLLEKYPNKQCYATCHFDCEVDICFALQEINTDLKVSDINLTSEVAKRVIEHFSENMLYYFDDETISYFDFDEDMGINQEESQNMLFWALDNYNVEQSTILSEEAMIKAAADYLAGKLDVPDKEYSPLGNTYTKR
jgi:hypothetical protein